VQALLNVIRFDPKALFTSLDAERTRRGLSWQELSRDMGVSASTMKRLEHGGRLEVDGMLTMVAWLGRKVESFTKQTER